ncbi:MULTISPECIES: CRISPR-associated protein Cas4 [Tepidanaerobacter]|uniref:CRISPR-associated protein Cas4 n=1 Tax=Tepidanaerobacter TaxID=499228 RepID=UPI000B0E2C1A|nr:MULTISPECIES: CRISPR-associated protein Cas4 [Tepidanaerobacter]
MSAEDVKINGTLIWYYCVCKREAWLIARSIVADQENEFIEIGRFIHESSYQREKKEMQIGNIKLDILKMDNGQIVIGEVKKSSKFKLAARMQLLFYLSILKENGISARGELYFPEEKKREEVLLNEEALTELEQMKQDILKIIYLEQPPAARKIPFCKNCAYAEFCFA